MHGHADALASRVAVLLSSLLVGGNGALLGRAKLEEGRPQRRSHNGMPPREAHPVLFGQRLIASTNRSASPDPCGAWV